MLIHEAAVAFVAVIDAALLWVQALAGASAFVFCVVAFVAFGSGPFAGSAVEAARSRLRARLTASRVSQAPEPHPSPKRRSVPSWAHTEPYDYDEAA